MPDLARIDLNLLVSLDALLRERNVSRAAERLRLSQPALSAQLAKLRRVLGDPLLVPSDGGRGMTPTPRALDLAVPLRDALQHLSDLVLSTAPFDPLVAQRTFRIAASDNAVITIGLPLLERCRLRAGPGVRIAFSPPDAARIAAQMERGEIDLLIGSERMVPPNMKARPLVTEHFVMTQRKRHPRGKAPPSLDEYCALPHLLVSTSGGSFHGYMDEQLEKLGRHRHVALSIQQFTLAPAILQATDLVCTLPSRLAQRYGRVIDALELPFRAEGFTLSLAWHPRSHRDSASTWLRGMLVDAMA